MSAICNNCPGYAGCALNPEGMPCKRHRKELGYYPSNADRIRDMSNEELARWLTYSICRYAKCGDACPVLTGEDPAGSVCITNILDWLAQPAQGEGRTVALPERGANA